jgi:phytoene synthase
MAHEFSVTEARATLEAGSKSFAFAARFLTENQRDAAALVYTFCRAVDDIADDEGVSSDLRAKELASVRRQVRGAEAPRACVAGLLEVDKLCGLPLGAAVSLVDGCESDVHRVCVMTDRDLIRYCYRVASTVGLLMCSVLGVRDAEARAFAIDLGVAMQLTNICRDVAEDAENGRVYLPAARLDAHGVLPEQLVDGTASAAGVRAVVLELLDLADTYYHSAMRGMRFLPPRARLAILVAAKVYRRIGVRLRANGGDALAGRTVVPLSGKLIEAAKAVMTWFRPDVMGLTPPPRHDSTLHIALHGLPHAHPPRAIAGPDEASMGMARAEG